MTTTNPQTEQEHEFVLVLTDGATLTAEVENALFEAGCDDATISVRSGRVYVTFARRSVSITAAVLSAIQQIRTANIGAEVLRVDDGNLVTQSDIARRIGRTRQLVHQYISGARGPGGFPPPSCEIRQESTLWSWCEVARWLWRNGMIEESSLREAEQIEAINAVLEIERQRKAIPALIQEVERVVQAKCEPV